MKLMKSFRLRNIFFSSLLILLCGCSNNTTNEYENTNSDDGYKPVIVYNGILYWLTTEKSPIILPEGFEDSQNVIMSCVADPMELPKEELSTSAKHCSGVGDKILINANDDSQIITTTANDKYLVFEKEQ